MGVLESQGRTVSPFCFGQFTVSVSKDGMYLDYLGRGVSCKPASTVVSPYQLTEFPLIGRHCAVDTENDQDLVCNKEKR